MTFIIVITYVVLGGLIFILFAALSASRKNQCVEIRDTILSLDELEKHAIELARNHPVGKTARGLQWLIRRLNDNFNLIYEAFKTLNEDVKGMFPTAPAAEWLLDNFYIIEEQVKLIKRSLSKGHYSRLPVLKQGYLRGYPRVYAIALELIAHTDGRIDEKALTSFLNAYQSQVQLSMGELWAISLMLRIALIENTRYVCEAVLKSQKEWHRAEKLAMLIADINTDEVEAASLVSEYITTIGRISPSFVEHLLLRLRKQGKSVSTVTYLLDNKLKEQNSSTHAYANLEHQLQASRQVSIGNTITGLKLVSDLDWTEIFETLSQVERILRLDPAKVYPEMDFDSRDYYRHEVEKLARAYNTSEMYIADKTVECCHEALKNNSDSSPTTHVGYFLVGKGKSILADRLLTHNRSGKRIMFIIKEHRFFFYILSFLFLTAFITSYFCYYANNASDGRYASYLVLVAILILIPCSEIANTILNSILSHLFKPTTLPKLELKDGIPQELTTMVIMPTLLTNEKRVRDLLEQLEVYYLGNRDDNLFFSLIGDFKDSNVQYEKGDNDIVNTALEGIKALNSKYASGEIDVFFYFQRQRLFNESQRKWMGWERKRGAIIEFVRLLRNNSENGFHVSSCSRDVLPNVKYVITLDADTCLPMKTAKRLIGTMAHPLNNAVADFEKGIVTEGYGLLQPRISVGIASANCSPFTRVFAGQGGIDPYTTAVSDIYQDIFHEGIFTGKGIFDVDIFLGILGSKLPENSILSHDLIEGCYLRTGLVTDIELVDGYPSRFSSYSMRLHRWTRGDWQLIPWLTLRVRNAEGLLVKNPLSPLSKWKIFDNLRRSLLNPFLFILLILGTGIFPGSFFVWAPLALAASSTPIIVGILNALLSGNFRALRTKKNTNTITGIKAAFYQSLLLIAFIPYQAYLMTDAILRTLARVIFTRRNMLEWVTAADMESILKNDFKSSVRRMWMAYPAFILIIILPLLLYNPQYLFLSIPIGLLWFVSPIAAYITGKPTRHKKEIITEEDRFKLRRLARKTWRYFEDFAVKEDNYLPPDNYQEEPPKGAAHRTSPTNIGLLLISALSAYDMGYISLMDLYKYLENVIATINKMQKWKGHLYNWYNTITLDTMKPLYVSTVDSGNFLGYLIVIREGLLEYKRKPILDINTAQGLLDTVLLLNEQKEMKNTQLDYSGLKSFVDNGQMDLRIWGSILSGYLNLIKVRGNEKLLDSYWGKRFITSVQSYRKELEDLYPAAAFHNDFRELEEMDHDLLEKLLTSSTLTGLSFLYLKAISEIDLIISRNKGKNNKPDINTSLSKALERLRNSCSVLEKYINQAEDLIGRINGFIESMEFTPLYDAKRQLFSIGFNVDEGHLSKSYYDLLASEARQASYIAIARGEADKKHWFRLGRKLASAEGLKGLISWTGTMFEYLMPLIIMKNFENTLFDETYSFVVHTQKRYGKHRKIPWGISESGYSAFDINLNYQYKAFGVPEIGLKRGLGNDVVVSPYSSVLAVTLDPSGVARNVRELEKMGMDGDYGFYEAVDFTPSRLDRNSENTIVKSFMAHHQGMSLAALNNYFNKNILQKRFHSDPVIKSAELLLQEKSPESGLFSKEYRDESTFMEKKVEPEEGEAIRSLGIPDSILPDVHILSNGSYSVLLTNGGSGYSKNSGMAVSRWSGDSRYGGMFVYIQNINSNNLWSATYEPVYTEPEKYKVVFSPDKAEFTRRDGNIETDTEITVSPEDNAEVRRISLTNHSEHSRIVELTSYFEVVLSNPEDDAAHPAFSKLFVRTEFVREHECLLASRRQRTEGRKPIWLIHAIAVDGATVGDIQYETDRMKFIGRNRSLSRPAAMEPDQPLSNSEGSVLDPVMSLRRRVRIEPGQTVKIAYTVAVAETRKYALELAEKYSDIKSSERVFELSWTRSQVETRYLGMKTVDVEMYIELLPLLLMYNPLRSDHAAMIEQNTKTQSDLWPFGISGDLPIMMAVIEGREDMELVTWVLKAHEFFRVKGIEIDLVILVEKEAGYSQPLMEMIRDAVVSSHARELIDRKGGVFIKSSALLDDEQKKLLYTAAKLVIEGSVKSLKEKIKQLEKLPYMNMQELKPLAGKTEVNEKNNDTGIGKLTFFNGLGGFGSDGAEYVIRLQKGQNTPAPWINVISNPRFGFIVSESGGGYVWSGNSRENKLTEWSNDPVTDMQGEVLYLKDVSEEKFWNITPMPVREDSNYIVKHGYGYSIFTHVSNGLEQNMTVFAASHDLVKISLVTLKNISEKEKNIDLTYYIRPVLGVRSSATTQYITTNFDEKAGIFCFKNKFANEFKDRLGFVCASETEVVYTGDRYEFIGINGSLKNPAAMYSQTLSGRTGAGLDPCAAIRISVKLRIGDEKRVVFLFGETSSIEDAEATAEKYRTPGLASGELAAVRSMWSDKLGAMHVYTPDKSLNIMLNGWLLYQVISCRLWSRSAFYQAGGAFGFRDQLQDSMAVLNIWPELTGKQILLHASRQFAQGDVQHWWHNETGRGIRTRYSDDLLWLPYVTAEYVEHTGDWSILEVEVPFIESDSLKENEDERYDTPWASRESATIYEHCLRAIELSLKFGVHGIPLMGSGDWNDGMNTVGNKGKGESVWLGWFLYTVLKKIIPICIGWNDKKSVEKYTSIAANIITNIEQNAWDGSWYRRAYFDDGTPLGSVQNSECRIDAIAQSWSVITGAARPVRTTEAMEAVEKYLVDREEGLIRLLTPPFDNGSLQPGYIKGYVPGVRENGGQYTHAAAWAIMAFAELGLGDKAWEFYHMINPINHTRTPIEYARYKVEPYVIAADVYAIAPHTGRGGWSWYTGAAGWLYSVGLESILGIRKKGDSLILDPCIPANWKEYIVNYKFGNSRYDIRILNPEGLNKGVVRVTADGRTYPGNTLTLADDGKEHSIEAVMGKS